MKLYASVELTVEMPCTPISNFSNLSELHMAGLMKKETLAKHAFELYGLPCSEIALSEYPDMMPKPEKKTTGGGGKGKKKEEEGVFKTKKRKKKEAATNEPGTIEN
jgi:hypothetical protein